MRTPPHKQRNSMMGTCSFGQKDTKKLLMLIAGFLFTGHCASDQLLEHYQTFVSRLGLDWHYLLHPHWDGWPKCQLSFQNKA